jgi:hypothetical protein
VTNAYKHGLLMANPEDVTLLDDAGAEVDGIVVWQRRRTGAEGYGHIPPPFDEMADYLAAAATATAMAPAGSSPPWSSRNGG